MLTLKIFDWPAESFITGKLTSLQKRLHVPAQQDSLAVGKHSKLANKQVSNDKIRTGNKPGQIHKNLNETFCTVFQEQSKDNHRYPRSKKKFSTEYLEQLNDIIKNYDYFLSLTS